MSDWIGQRLQGSLAAIESLRELTTALAAICETVTSCLTNHGTVYTAGNGGSAAQALHLAEELIGRYRTNRPPQRALCLNADSAALTCIANDFGYQQVFARQCEALLTERDLFIGLSTSGNSTNIIEAFRVAQRKNSHSIGLLGADGGACLQHCNQQIIVPRHDSAHIQEAHQVVIHLICEAVEHARG